MASTLQPKTCPSDAWRTWARDGAKLGLRSLSGWAVVLIALTLSRGWWMTATSGVVSVFMVMPLLLGLTAALELAHLAVMDTLRHGQVSLLDSLRAVGRVWRHQLALLGRTLRTRTLVGLGYAVLSTLIMLALIAVHAFKFNDHPAVPTLTTGQSILTWFQNSASVVLLSLYFRLGGVISLVLPLMRDHDLGADHARQLNGSAAKANAASFTALGHIGRLGLLASAILLPYLTPLVELWLAGTLSCAYADIFGEGYTVQALARAKVKGVAGDFSRA